MTTPELPLDGRCLCGSVRVRVTAAPLLTLACHCRDCQKLAASAYSLTAMIPAEGFSVSGNLVTGGLGTDQRRHQFCANCLTFVFTRIVGAETRVNLRASVLDDLTWFEPFVETMTEEKMPWAQVPAAHSFARYPKTIEELETLFADYAKR